MSEPAKEWEDMSATEKTQILNRLHAVCANKADLSAYVLRQRLANASRPALAAALDRLN